MKMNLLYLIPFLTLLSCNNINPHKKVLDSKFENTTKDSSKDLLNTETLAEDSFSLERKLIMGEWQIDEDIVSSINNTVVFTNDLYMDKQGNKYIDTYFYSFSKTSCEESGSTNTTDRFLYLILKEKKNRSTKKEYKLCYSIDNLDSQRLTLMYLQRGNILTYRRVQ